MRISINQPLWVISWSCCRLDHCRREGVLVIQQFTQERLHPGCYMGVSITWKRREMQWKKSGRKTII